MARVGVFITDPWKVPATSSLNEPLCDSISRPGVLMVNVFTFAVRSARCTEYSYGDTR